MTAAAPYQIVVGVDLSEYSEIVLQHAFDQAIRHERPTLHVVTVVPIEHGFWRRPSDQEIVAREVETQRELAALVRRALDDAVPAERREAWPVRIHVRRGRPEVQLVEVAAEVWADLLVVGRFGHADAGRLGLRHRIGSVADRLIQGAECPVLVVTPAREATASARQCPECVRVRAESAGEAWFCDAHHTSRLPGLSALVAGPSFRRGEQGSSGGTMW